MQQPTTWRIFYVDKLTGSSADQLQAAGLAVLLRAVAGGKLRVLIRDAGSHYRIELDRPIASEALTRFKPLSLFQPLRTIENAVQLQGMDFFDYTGEREYADAYRERRRKLEPALHGPTADLDRKEELRRQLGEPPKPVLSIYSAIRGYKVVDSINELARAWHNLPEPALAGLVAALLSAFATSPNDIDGLADAWDAIAREHRLAQKAYVTQLQITNSVAGKGANRPKATNATAGNLKHLWLLELLRVAGYFQLAVPLVVGGGRDSDRKTYMLRPHEAEFSMVEQVMTDFRRVLWSASPVKLDCIAILRFTDLFYDWHERRIVVIQDALDDPSVNPSTATAFVHGFDVIFSKNMGNAFATMNISTINLPDWLPEVPPGTSSEGLHTIKQARALLDEHLRVVQSIGNRGPGRPAEEGADELELLQHYRDFLSSRGDFSAFFAFTNAYGPYILAQRGRNRRAVQLSTANLEVIMQTSSYREITTNHGFQDIADCIRQATVTEQYRTAVLRQGRYEIRYGLGQDLARAAKDNKEFLIALSTFLRAYGAENAREEEKLANRHEGKIPDDVRKGLRPNPRTGDIDEVVRLVDAHGADLVCALLLAYGYARKGEPRERRDDAPDPTETQAIPDGESAG